ncbi:flavin reductase family protein [Salisaeta longa]|uniref:flavin reductase family protein n=1 Tax=Salisaeta longa TaxID=503170 RepID=UPI0003B718E8|nr:flavin reductase family protein [Salisaeta longa]
MSDPSTSERFRSAMRRVPSPVVVVTAAGPSGGRGITIGSFTSVALEPPLVSFNVAHDASMHALLERAERYAVHVLTEEQAHLAQHFALPDLSADELWAPVAHERRADGLPVLADTSAVLLCTPHGALPAGDHTLFVGRVMDVVLPPDAGAVLYYKRDYHAVGSTLRSKRFSPVNRGSSASS